MEDMKTDLLQLHPKFYPALGLISRDQALVNLRNPCVPLNILLRTKMGVTGQFLATSYRRRFQLEPLPLSLKKLIHSLGGRLTLGSNHPVDHNLLLDYGVAIHPELNRCMSPSIWNLQH